MHEDKIMEVNEELDGMDDEFNGLREESSRSATTNGSVCTPGHQCVSAGTMVGLNNTCFTKANCHRVVHSLLLRIFFATCIYLCLFILDSASPTLSKVIIIYIGSIIGGSLCLGVVPALVGMIAVGIILRNMECFHFISDQNERALSDMSYNVIRTVALSVILMRSGMELNLSAMQKMGGWKTVIYLTILPCTFEAVSVGVSSHLLLGMPILLGFTMGFILSAVSPAVVVSGMLNLINDGYGDKVPSLVIASASMDDVISISGFAIFCDLFLDMQKGHDTGFVQNIVHGPLIIALGLLLGCLGGAILSLDIIFDCKWKRNMAILIIGLLITFGTDKAHFGGSGMLACIVLGVVYRSSWVLEHISSSNNIELSDCVDDITSFLSILWEQICEPTLFGSIGYALDVNGMKNETILLHGTIIVLGLSLRISSAYFATNRANFSSRERLFIAFSWIPKATVQAALCSLPLNAIKEKNLGEEYEKYGLDIINVAILSILLTAPIGGAVVQYLGPYLLERSNNS